MPIIIPNNLPTEKKLKEEGLYVISHERAMSQDIRPLKIGLLNLMPDKVTTEIQFSRLLGSLPLQVELFLLKVNSYTPKNTSKNYLNDFYIDLEQAKSKNFDGLIITGAPVETLEYENVIYWDELKDIFKWAKNHVFSTFNVCWSAQAALYYFRGIKKFLIKKKMFGLFWHRCNKKYSYLTNGLDDIFIVPVSRYSMIKKKDIQQHNDLEILIESDESGLCLVNDKKYNQVYMFNHLEYDAKILYDEYLRDKKKGKDVLPKNYFKNNDINRPSENIWRSSSRVLYNNWISYVYKNTPFNLIDIKKSKNA